MVLDKLHVFQGNSGTVGEGHTIARFNRSVGGERKDAPASARAKDHGLAGDDFDLTGVKVEGRDPPDFAVIGKERS